MKVGSLVRHKKTLAVGIVVETGISFMYVLMRDAKCLYPISVFEVISECR